MLVFIRHNRLEEPFDNYEHLTLEELDALSLGEVSPQIQKDVDISSLPESVIEILKTADQIVCSESIRTQQTFLKVAKKLNIDPAPFKIDKRLNEISFQPSKILEGDEKEEPLKYIREKLYQHIALSGKFATSKHDLDKTIKSILKIFLKQILFASPTGS